MAFKFIALLALVAAANAALLPVAVKHVEYHDAPAEYQFSYSVHDDHTGDIKSQTEERHGDVVKGQYSLIDADGHKRIVDYSADDHSGFNAIVHREPLGHKLVKTIVPVAKTIVAPIAHHYVSPVAKVVAPVTHLSYSNPSLSYHY
ncbi:cuticle protein-like [Toxorhynchites rutilus septentrionalis]|uniref:cuticle protein-like n=1 Tax=Toxorhynchites rutilus septentrionalis TaxID=329112 RepID=UPI00247A51BF|nr:cuticle protein-like [Toxorhynchites rutilus septentrionalis]